MKPRVLWSADGLRLVRTYQNCFFVERATSRDAMGQMRWLPVDGDALNSLASSLVRSFGVSLVRREKALRRARRSRR